MGMGNLETKYDLKYTEEMLAGELLLDTSIW